MDEVRARGWCALHYRRLLRHGDALYPVRPQKRATGSVPHGTPHGYNHHKCRCEMCARWRLEYNRAARLKRQGLNAELWARMNEAQRGLCAICSRPGSGNTRTPDLYVDHDHITGDPRGLLCGRCNQGVGFFRDDPELLLAAVAYLRAHQGATT